MGKEGETTTTRGKKETDVRRSNMLAARGVADAIRTSLGPKGMDKMITTSNGEVVITNDGATILQKMEVVHPAAKMLVELSKSQDIEAGDGTTSVVVIAGALLRSAEELLEKGIHATQIAESWKLAANEANKILRSIGEPVELSDRASLVKAATTSLNSKVVSQFSPILAPMAVDAVLKVIQNPKEATSVDLRDIRVVAKVGGTVEETELIDGIMFKQHINKAAGGPGRLENVKVGLIQFQLSAPKTDMEQQIIVSDNAAIDRLAREEKKYILKMVKKIAKEGCNLLLIQKSILRDAVNVLSLHYLAKKGIMVVTDIERDEIEFISKTLGCRPIAHIDAFTKDKLGEAKLAEEVYTSEGRILRITGVKNPGLTCTIFVRGSNKLMLEEAERSIHDALCVIRCLVKVRYMIAGGGAPETEVSMQLLKFADTLGGLDSYCVKAFAEALEVVPYTLAENAGLHPIKIVTELRKQHSEGHKFAGINVKMGTISDLWKENVIQPLLVSCSAMSLASECVQMLLKIDDCVATR